MCARTPKTTGTSPSQQGPPISGYCDKPVGIGRDSNKTPANLALFQTELTRLPCSAAVMQQDMKAFPARLSSKQHTDHYANTAGIGMRGKERTAVPCALRLSVSSEYLGQTLTALHYRPANRTGSSVAVAAAGDSELAPIAVTCGRL
jgi:hypothetical protein